MAVNSNYLKSSYAGICFILASLLLNCLCSADSEFEFVEGNCKEGWDRYGNKCFKIFSNNRDNVTDKNYYDALEFCKEQDNTTGTLASIVDEWDQDFLTSYLGRPGVTSEVYIGLKRPSRGEKHEWVDGTKFEYDNWVPGEPNDDVNEACAQLQIFEISAGMWNDVACGTPKGFICQAAPDPSLPEQEEREDSSICPDQFENYMDSCYFVSDEEKSWLEAQQACELKGANLVSVVDNFEWAYLNILTEQINSSLWIGLSAKISDLRLFDYHMRHHLEWSDHRHVHHLDWDEGQPKYSNSENVQCVEMRNTKYWAIDDCSKEKHFICQKHSKIIEKPERATGLCPSKAEINHELIEVGHENCYMISHNNSANWNGARLACQKQGGDLAVFKNKVELNHLRPYINPTVHNSKMFWVGIRSNYNNGVYQAINGVEFDENLWEKGEPNNLKSEKCALIYGQAMTYYNSVCYSDQYYICEFPKVSVADSLATGSSSEVESSGDGSMEETSKLPLEENDYEYLTNSINDKYEDIEENLPSISEIIDIVPLKTDKDDPSSSRDSADEITTLKSETDLFTNIVTESSTFNGNVAEIIKSKR